MQSARFEIGKPAEPRPGRVRIYLYKRRPWPFRIGDLKWETLPVSYLWRPSASISEIAPRAVWALPSGPNSTPKLLSVLGGF